MINSNINSNNNYYLPQNTVNNIVARKHNDYNTPPTNTFDAPENKPKKKGLIGWIMGASTLTLIVGVAILFKCSPKFIKKNINKLKSYFKKKSSEALSNSKNKKLYNKIIKGLNWTTGKVNCANNFNNLKDIGYAKLCSLKCFGGENSPLVKINKKITKFFKGMAKNTVYRNYHSADKNYNELIDSIIAQKSKFSPEEWWKIEKNITEIQELINKGFSNQAISTRLRNQNSLMKDLDKKVLDRTKLLLDKNYYKNHNFKDNALYVDNNLKFFSEDILSKDKDAYKKTVQALKESITNQSENGKIQKLLTSLKNKLPENEFDKIATQAKRANKSLDKAVINETNNYFDKARDLNLGGANTDIITMIGSTAIAGAIIAKADDKDERISKALTRGIPIVGTIGTSLLLSANLVAGTKALIFAGLSGLAMSKFGELVDNSRTKMKDKKAKKIQNLIDEEIKKRNQT